MIGVVSSCETEICTLLTGSNSDRQSRRFEHNHGFCENIFQITRIQKPAASPEQILQSLV